MTFGRFWVSDVRRVAAEIGLRGTSRRVGPCPACGAKVTSKSDSRGPVLLGAQWRCLLCKQGGDAVSMAGHYLGLGGAPRGRSFHVAKNFVDGTTNTEIVEPEVRHLPIADALRGAVPLDKAPPTCRDYLVSRGLTTSAPAAWLPHPPAWFPLGYPLVVPFFSGRAELLSMQGHAIDGRQNSKTWPRGASATGLLMLDPNHARKWLKGGTKPDELWITEGMIDYLWVAQHGVPTIGVVAGSFSALKTIDFSGIHIRSAMHADDAGTEYTTQLAKVVYPTPIYPVPLERL